MTQRDTQKSRRITEWREIAEKQYLGFGTSVELSEPSVLLCEIVFPWFRRFLLEAK